MAWQGWTHAQDATERGKSTIQNAIKAHEKDTADLTLDNNPTLGTKEKKAKTDPGINAAKICR